MVRRNQELRSVYLRAQFVTIENGVACCDTFQISTLMSHD
jgi:hypothetical protein